MPALHHRKSSQPRDLKSVAKHSRQKNAKINRAKSTVLLPILLIIGVLAFGSLSNPDYQEVSANVFNLGNTTYDNSGLVINLDFTKRSGFSATNQQEVVNQLNQRIVGTLGANNTAKTDDPTWDPAGYLSFNGKDQILKLDNTQAPKNDLTYELLVRTRLPDANAYVIASDAKDGNKSTVGIKTQDKYWWYFGFNQDRKVYIPFPESSVNTAWHHVVISRQEESIAVFVDGVAAQVIRDINKYPLQNDYFTIGARNFKGEYSDFFSGDLAQVRIYTKNLTDAEIKANYLQQKLIIDQLPTR